MEFSLRYITLYEMVTGERFSPPPAELDTRAYSRESDAIFRARPMVMKFGLALATSGLFGIGALIS